MFVYGTKMNKRKLYTVRGGTNIENSRTRTDVVLLRFGGDALAN